MVTKDTVTKDTVTKDTVNSCTEVDLLQIGSDIGSTREFLVFLEHACFSVTPKSPGNCRCSGNEVGR